MDTAVVPDSRRALSERVHGAMMVRPYCWFLDPSYKTVENYVERNGGKIAVLCGHSPEYLPLAKHTIYQNKSQYCKRHGYDLHVVLSLRAKYIDSQSHASGFSWSRMADMLDLVKSGKYEWVWCVGADTLITNMTIPLEQIIAHAETEEAMNAPLPHAPVLSVSLPPPRIIDYIPPKGHPMTGRKHLLICGECLTSLQADSFMIRGSKEGAAYLRDILAQYNLYKHHPWVENQAMIDLREKHASITHIVPAWMMNSYDCSRWYGIHPRFKQHMDCYGNRMHWQKGDFLIHWPASTLEQRLKWYDYYSNQITT